MINTKYNSLVKAMGAKWSGTSWTPPELARPEFDALTDQYFGDPVTVELTVNDDNYQGDYLGSAHAITVADYVIATAYGRDSGARIADGVAIVSGGVISGGSAKNFRCKLKRDEPARIRMKIGRAMVDSVLSIVGADAVVIDAGIQNNPLSKFSTEDLVAELARRNA